VAKQLGVSTKILTGDSVEVGRYIGGQLYQRAAGLAG